MAFRSYLTSLSFRFLTFKIGMHSFPRTTVTNFQTWWLAAMGIYSFHRLEILNQVVSRAALPLKSLGASPFPVPGGCRHSLANCCVTPTSNPWSHCLQLLSVTSLFLSFIKTLVIGFKAHPDNPK